MNTVEFEIENAALALEGETVIHLPSGLLGFEQIKQFVLSPATEALFYWLRAQSEPGLSFLVVCPFEVLPEYAPDIPAEEVRALGIECPDDVILFNIITLRANGPATINLKGPIVMNRFSRIAKQVIISNSADYSLQHPLVSESKEQEDYANPLA
jgi:flagellar assembly factor FliW